jgi:GntR family transcriptional regulator
MNTVLPIYYQIKQTIKKWIITKEFEPLEKIPSENELAQKFKVNRLTVRQAISQLIQEGFLESRRGEGTFVTDNENLINSYNVETSGYLDDLFPYQLKNVKTKVATIEKIVVSKRIREILKLDKGEKEITQIKRVRLLNDRLFTYTINYLPLVLGSMITEADLYKKRLLQILEENLGVRFTEAVQTIEASFANYEVAKRLEIPSGSPVLSVEKIMYAQRHQPIEFFQSYYRGDLYKFIIRFRNVKRKEGNKWIHRFDPINPNP